MTHTDRFDDRHPLCTCPPVTFTSAPTTAQISTCRDRSRGITHPVLTAADLHHIIRGMGHHDG